MRKEAAVPVCVLMLLGLSGMGRAQARKQPAPSRVSADTVCSFITGKMMSALPQVPTLCAVKKESRSEYYELSVFCPTDVLEGKMRRAWSSALFQTAQALFIDGALNGACEATSYESPKCQLDISDSYLSELHLYYRLQEWKVGLMDRYDALSDDWYRTWWDHLMRHKKLSDPAFASKGNAETRGSEACREYLQAIREWNTAVQSAHPQAEGLSVPRCSALLVTDSSFYAVLDFAEPGWAAFVNYRALLPETFGKEFSGSVYDGAVIFRSSWSERARDRAVLQAFYATHAEVAQASRPVRAYSEYPLGDIEFSWEESSSGVRTAAWDLLHPEVGQTDHDTGTDKDRIGAAVVRLAPVQGTGRVLVDLTDGSEWSVSSDEAARCGLKAGTGVFAMSTTPSFWRAGFLFSAERECTGVTFAGSWDEHDNADTKSPKEGLASPAAPGALTRTIFRDHTLGENWEAFARTDGGLCQLSQANAEACALAAAGKAAVLTQSSEGNHAYASVAFSFERGRFVEAFETMEGPTPSGLTFLDKTYGTPTFKSSNPQKGESISRWDFPDGGSVVATERIKESGRVTIEVTIVAGRR